MSTVQDEVFQEVLGSILSHFRKERQLSQTRLAEQVNITQSMLSRMEQGLSMPDAIVFRKLATKMGMTTDKLYKFIDDVANKAEQLAAATGRKPKKDEDWWDATFRVLGAAGVASLIGLAVAAIWEGSRTK